VSAGPGRLRLVHMVEPAFAAVLQMTLVKLLSRADTTRTFHARNDVSSIIVDWTISWPGNTPHVTALTASFSVLVLKSPCGGISDRDPTHTAEHQPASAPDSATQP
jgi:hypothetical protein